MAGRKRGFRHPEEVREKIQASNLINRLADHIDGKTKMTTTQVNAAKVLLNKILPDLKATELTGAGGQDLFPKEITRRIVDPKDDGSA